MLQLYKYNDATLKKVLSSTEIIVDTREVANSHILEWLTKHRIKYRVEKLNLGDYSLCIPKNDEFNIPRDLYLNNEIVIERKGSLDELAGNFTNDRTRIEEEFASYKGKMTLLIENASYNDIVEQKYRSQYKPTSFAATLHTFADRYEFNYMFLPDNKYSGQVIAYTLRYHLRNQLKK